MNERRKQFAKSIDGRLPTPKQLEQLGEMAADAFLEIRAKSDDRELVHALADAFHCLPSVMFSPDFSWSYLLIFLADLDRVHPEPGRKYLAAFDMIVGFDGQ